MKIIKFSFFIILIFHLSVIQAQNNEIQLALGGTLSTVSFDDTIAQSAVSPHLRPKFGYSFSMGWEHYFASILSLRTVISYTQKGFAYTYTYRQGYKTFNYLVLTAAGNIQLYRGPSVEIGFSIAPFVGYWISGFKFEADYRGNALYAQKIVFSDSTYSYNRWDAGVAAGLHLKYWQTITQALTLDIGFDYSAVSNDRQNVAGTKNRTLYFRIGYLWTL